MTHKLARPLLLLLPVLLLAGALHAPSDGQPSVEAATPALWVYADQLGAGWENWSWDTGVNLAATSPRHGGSFSIRARWLAGWAGFQLGRSGGALDISAYDTLQFWVHGGASGGQKFNVHIGDGANGMTSVTFTAPANAWGRVRVPLARLGMSGISVLWWQSQSAAAQAPIFLDDIALIKVSTATPTRTATSGGPTRTVTRTATSGGPSPTRTRTATSGGPSPTRTRTATAVAGLALNVDVAASRRAISPYIYGMNFIGPALANELDLPVRRWGGNSTTRYNWQTDVSNKGSDWFFENIPEISPRPPNLPHGSATDLFVEEDRQTGANTLLTVPLIGWTPRPDSALGHPFHCGFKVSKYGAQQANDWEWDPDCGNGKHTNGTNITGNDPLDTSVAIGPAFVKSWIAHLTAKYGTAANGGVLFYNLDNEPELWHETHRDVWPTGVSYDQMRDKTYAYGAAVKQADASALTLGPASFGWTGYLMSGKDMQTCSAPNAPANCWSNPPDRAAHGGLEFIPWYLQQMQAYQTVTGTRILDYLDLHYYPQEGGVSLSPVGDSTIQARRLMSTRALWDPSYLPTSNGSWIDQPPYLIRRMRQWVDAYYPGTKLAMTEYNWGGLAHINGALAQADVLGIFGREGMDLATLWSPPSSSQPGAYAFRMYRNYNGAGGKFGDTSVAGGSTAPGKLALFAAQRSSDGALTLMVINKTAGALSTPASLAGFTPSGPAQVYRYSAANLGAIVRQPDVAVGASFNMTFPASSITLLVIPGS